MRNRTIFHIDANSAYLSWSAVRALQLGSDIDLRTIPSAVGGNQATRHGIILAKSAPTKQFGIKTGETLIEARLKCRGLVVVPPDYFLYMKCSNEMFNIMREYSDQVQVFSIDEGFIDFTGMERVWPDPLEAAHKIKDRIKNELGFTVSVGVSSNKLLAKMGSELKKPDGVSTLYPDDIKDKMWPLPVRELYMVGGATERKLLRLGINTIGRLAETPIEILNYHFKSYGTMLKNYANGIEDSSVNPLGSIPNMKGLGNSATIHFDVEDARTAHKVILSLVETVAMRLRHAGFSCQLVSVSIRTADLLGYLHQKKYYIPTNCTNTIYQRACDLFNEMWKGEPIRQFGVRVSELCSNDYIQLSMLEKYKDDRLDKAIDGIRLKYGSSSVIRAAFLHSGLSPLEGGVAEDFQIMTSIL